MMRNVSPIVLFFIMAVSLLAHAQSTGSHAATKQPHKTQSNSATPSAAPQPETALKWLQANYRINGAVSFTGAAGLISKEDPDMSFSGCTVSSADTTFFGGDTKGARRKFTICLGGISSEIVVKQEQPTAAMTPVGEMWELLLHTRNGDKLIEVVAAEDTAVPGTVQNKFVLSFNNGDIAKRAANALRDAILACGGSKEAY